MRANRSSLPRMQHKPPRWWQTGVVYQVYPRSFADATGGGTGDLAGITGRLDYIAWLGVDAIWISPFYPSPMADFGYDVSNYTDVDPIFGSLADFDELLAAAHDRGVRVLIDYVPNHTSDQHPWFVESRSSQDEREARLVRVARCEARRLTAEQLDQHVRRAGVGLGRGHRPVLPAHVPQGAARPQLAEPRDAGRDVRRRALLARPRRRRLPDRRGADGHEGPRAARQPTQPRARCRLELAARLVADAAPHPRPQPPRHARALPRLPAACSSPIPATGSASASSTTPTSTRGPSTTASARTRSTSRSTST